MNGKYKHNILLVKVYNCDGKEQSSAGKKKYLLGK